MQDPAAVEKDFQLDELVIPTEVVPPPPAAIIADLINEDDANQDGPYRFATSVSVNFSMENSGEWYDLDKKKVWVLRIKSPGAKSISLALEYPQLPETSKLYVICESEGLVSGPMHDGNIPSLPLTPTEIFPKDEVLLYYEEPYTAEYPINIKISKLSYGYKLDKSNGQSLPCQIEVTDQEGDCFRMEQLAVAKLLFYDDGPGEPETSICTSTLINGLGQDITSSAMLITANHCTVDVQTLQSKDLSNTRARFKDWAGNNSWVTFYGMTEIAATGNISDGSLLRLDQSTAGRELFYLGWSRSGNSTNESTIIHHPMGDVMKISWDGGISVPNSGALNFGAYFIPVGQAWTYSYGDLNDSPAALEQSSSGSAMLDQNHLIIGQIKGGDPFSLCSATGDQFAGRFDFSWNTGTTPDTRYSDWLDPMNTGVQTLNTSFEVSGHDEIPCPGIEQDLRVPMLSTIVAGAYNYTWRTSNGLSIIGSGSEVKFTDDGTCTGCSGWIECDITTPTTCVPSVTATSFRKNIAWSSPSATNFAHQLSPGSTNNGNSLGSYNVVCQGGNYKIIAGFQGIPIPSNTVIDWQIIGSPGVITLVAAPNGHGAGFITNTTGITTIRATIVSGTGCLDGKQETYIIDVRPCRGPKSSKKELVLDTELQFKMSRLFVRQNPIKNKIDFEIRGPARTETITALLVGLDGKIVLRKKLIATNLGEIDVSSLPSGIYTLLLNSSSETFQERIVIAR